MTMFARLARASLLVAAPALCMVRPPAVLHAGGATPTAMRACVTMSAGGQSKRAARRKRFEAREASTDAASGIKSDDASGGSSTELSSGDVDESVAARVAEMARLRQPQKALQLYNATAAEQQPEVLPLVIRALLKMRCIDVALELQRQHALSASFPLDTRSASTLFLALCRTGRLEEASSMLAELEAAHPTPSEPEASTMVAAMPTADTLSGVDGNANEPMWHAIGSVMLPALVLARVESGDVAAAASLAVRLAQQPSITMPPEYMLTKLIRQFGRQRSRSLRGVFACIDARTSARHEPTAEWLQVMVDACVRSIRFVKGGVSMSTLPEEPYPEVAFVGRSNVGKSSLTNFFVGRRAIAYTSKTPGKTQQYNYFVLNEPFEPSRRSSRRRSVATEEGEEEEEWRSSGTFHLVDMPGLGYAKAPGAERRKWLSFLDTYARERPQLKMIVHLIDGELGPLDTDIMLMEMVRDAAADEVAAAVAQRRYARTSSSSGESAEDDEAAEQEGGGGGEEEKGVTPAATAVDAPFEGGGAGSWQYAIVLTKVDKAGPKAAQRAEELVRRAVEETGCPQPVKVVVTSSSRKVGREAMWQLLRGVVLGEGA